MSEFDIIDLEWENNDLLETIQKYKQEMIKITK